MLSGTVRAAQTAQWFKINTTANFYQNISYSMVTVYSYCSNKNVIKEHLLTCYAIPV